MGLSDRSARVRGVRIFRGGSRARVRAREGNLSDIRVKLANYRTGAGIHCAMWSASAQWSHRNTETAMNLTTISTTSQHRISQSPQGSQPTGIRLVPGELCQYGDIDTDCVMRVDFDQVAVDRSGLYLVEAVTDDGVTWMGCRRFDRGLTGLRMDETGAGDWRDVGVAGLRVVGRVLKVYRAG